MSLETHSNIYLNPILYIFLGCKYSHLRRKPQLFAVLPAADGAHIITEPLSHKNASVPVAYVSPSTYHNTCDTWSACDAHSLGE